MEARIKIKRKETRERLAQLNPACELLKLMRHFFPDFLLLLKKIPDPRNQSYITCPGAVLLMTRILSSLFYISSMRKTSEEFNSDKMIENIWMICGEEAVVGEIPCWETINRYLEKIDPEELQDILRHLCRRLLRSRVFENMRIRNRYWQIVTDGTQLYSTWEDLDGKSLYRIHNKGTENEYRKNYYYVLEAKLVLHPRIIINIQTEFVDNENEEEYEKQDCERKACWRLIKKQVTEKRRNKGGRGFFGLNALKNNKNPKKIKSLCCKKIKRNLSVSADFNNNSFSNFHKYVIIILRCELRNQRS